MLELFYRAGRHPTIEQIQDNVEKAISAEGDFWGGARAYIVYRTTQATQWQNRYEENGLGDYIAIAKYARYRADLGRRELFVEAAQRVRDMHRVFFRDRLVGRWRRRRMIPRWRARTGGG
jgi:ribonucleoside-diphosphate reductase alpha chain